jgi:hypothetical protein
VRILCAVAICLVPSGAFANAAFERGVNAHLRAYEACARGSGPQACGRHLTAAREGMVRLGYPHAQAERHVSLNHDRLIAPRLRAGRERAGSPAASPPPRASRPRKAAPEAQAGIDLRDWSLCLEKARADVLAYPLAPELDVAGTAGAIVRACNGFEETAREIHRASGRSETEADLAVRAFAHDARAAATSELERRLARIGGRKPAP